MNHPALIAIAALWLEAIFAASLPTRDKLLQLQDHARPNREKITERSEYGYQPHYYDNYGYGLGYNNAHLGGYGFNAGHGYHSNYGLLPYSGSVHGLSTYPHPYGLNAYGGISHQGQYGGFVPGINSYSSALGGLHDSIYSGIQGGHGYHHKVPHYRSQNFEDNSSPMAGDNSFNLSPQMSKEKSAYEPYDYSYGVHGGHGKYGYGPSVGVFNNVQSGYSLPFLVSCQPNLVRGHFQSFGAGDYPNYHGVSAYRNSDSADQEGLPSVPKEDNSTGKLSEGRKDSMKETDQEKGQNFSKN